MGDETKPSVDEIRGRHRVQAAVTRAHHVSAETYLEDVGALLAMIDAKDTWIAAQNDLLAVKEARIEELEAQMAHELKRADALAEFSRMSNESEANANRAGMRVEARLREVEARLKALLHWRDRVQDFIDGATMELPYEGTLVVTSQELQELLAACPERPWEERVVGKDGESADTQKGGTDG